MTFFHVFKTLNVRASLNIFWHAFPYFHHLAVRKLFEVLSFWAFTVVATCFSEILLQDASLGCCSWKALSASKVR